MIIVDTETTGTDPRYHSLLSIGAVDFDDPENEFYGECRVFDGAHIAPEALAINGFTEEQIHDPSAKTEKQLVQEFLAWTERIGDKTLAGQNPSFDMEFLKAAAGRSGLPWDFARRTVDLHSIAYAHMLKRGIEPPSKNSHTGLNLANIIAYCGLPENKGAHNAHDDVLFTAECLSRLIHGHSSIGDFEKFPIPSHLA